MFTFIGKSEPTYVEVEQKIQQVLALFKKVENNPSNEKSSN